MRSLAAFTIAIILVLATMPAPKAQEKTKPAKEKRECGTEVSPRQIELEHARQARVRKPGRAIEKLVAELANAPYYFPLTIHIVRQSNHTGGLTLDQLALAMQGLNRQWQQAGIQFFIHGAIDYIDNDGYFYIPDLQVVRDALRRVNPVADTINVYFTNLTNLCGQGTFTTDPVQGVLMDIGCAGVASNPSSFPHEIGHYFDLYHTHETASGVECPSESNCSTAGDFVCDTPADPGLEGRVNDDCTYDGSAMTPTSCDNTAYNPPVRNLMSYSNKTCRDQITAGQISRVLDTLLNERSNLINSFSKYVAHDADPESTDCTYQNPCLTINAAVAAAKLWDHIFISPAVYPSSPLSINKQVFLEKWGVEGGAVRIQ